MDKPPEGYKYRGLITPEQALDLLNLQWELDDRVSSLAGRLQVVFELLYEKEDADE